MERQHLQEMELRSEEVQEVMGQVPPWIVRWGTASLFIVLWGVFVGSCFFRYPEVAEAEMTLSARHPVVEVMSQHEGRISRFFVAEGQRVEAGMPLAVIENAACTEDVFQLRQWLRRYERDPERLVAGGSTAVWRLGSIQPAYSALLEKHPGEMDFRAAVGALWTALREWEMAYCIEAPVAGRVAFFRPLTPYQYVSVGERFARLLPENPGEWIGHATIALADAGQVRAGQRAIVRFAAFPDQVYGTVEGVVREVAPLPAEAGYRVEIGFPQGGVTRQGHSLPLRQGMVATVEIVTRERRLIERLLPIRIGKRK